MTIPGRDERTPLIVMSPPTDADTHDQDAEESRSQYITAREVAAITGLPIHMFGDRDERDRKQIPYLSLVGNLRFSMEAILQWELANSVPGITSESLPAVATAEPDSQPDVPARVPRWYVWYELVGEQD